MADQQLKRLKQGAETWNQWRKEHPDEHVDLSGATLSRAPLSGANLSGANLRGAKLSIANLRGADLRRADLRGADLIKASLSGANLSGANLSRATLWKADLSEANLSEAHLNETHLSEATLSKATLSGADFNKANLSRAILSEAIFNRANLSEANLSGANLSGATLNRTILVGTNFKEAILTGCQIYGISAWDVQLEGAKQFNLVITPPNRPGITVDDLEVAQFVYLLLNHKKLRNVLNAVTERGVLLLGRFGDGGLEILQAIAAKLREENYLPIMFDFERPQDRNYTEPVKTLAGLARFVIADLSGPSVPQELYATVPHFKIPFVPLIEASRKPYSMAVDIFEYPWVIRPPITFSTTEELLEQIPTKVIAPAEEKHQARQKLLDELFNKA